MISYLTKRGFSATIHAYVADYSEPSGVEFVVLSYEDLMESGSIPFGAIVFSDIERLSPAESAYASRVKEVVRRKHPELQILNDPALSLRRYDLLTALAEAGLNRVRAYRLTDAVAPDRFPAFIRYADDHTGSTTGLLHDQREMDAAIVRLRLRGHDLSRMIIVEFVDTSLPDGSFVKYGAFRVGDRILARSRNASPHWVAKANKNPTDDDEQLARAYVLDNPHVDQLETIFDTARIEYGRIDYSLVGGEIVVWEINTNPTVFYPRGESTTAERQLTFARGFNEAFAAIDPREFGASISLEGIPASIRSEAAAAPSMYQPTAFKAWLRRYKSSLEPLAELGERAIGPLNPLVVADWKRRNGIG